MFWKSPQFFHVDITNEGKNFNLMILQANLAWYVSTLRLFTSCEILRIFVHWISV